ncbi:tetratricopeptide repeat protein [Mangrovimonas aestuarii]|uniref:tetratricopeptide repeat protein n=1 Tax=Mangrovimonas aestuarii TaxID=3018443 RepID=UPI002378C5A3|nr:tetratricopeptide repeat protein [Mangrovimonas aestuarii]
MNVTQTYAIIIVFFLSFWQGNTRTHIHQKDIDSILNRAINEIYEDPNKAIEMGLEVYNNQNYEINTRIRGLVLVATAYGAKRDYQKALSLMVESNELIQGVDDVELKVDVLWRTATFYQQLRVFDKAIQFLDEAERLALDKNNRQKLGSYLPSIYAVKGLVYKDKLSCDIALEFFEKSLKEYWKTSGNTDNFRNRSVVQYNRGNCFILLGDYKSAIESYNAAIELAETRGANSLVAFGLKGLAEVYTLEGNYQEAIGFLNTALQLSATVGDLVLNREIYEGLYENYLALNDKEKYQKYSELFYKTQLKVKELERASISNSITDFSKAIQKQKQQAKRDIKFNLLVVLIAILIVIFTVIIIKRKNDKIVKSLKIAIENLQKTKLSKG